METMLGPKQAEEAIVRSFERSRA
ncbi:uncharacterized protein G2W53_010526 [Senna tora]|uniref:Uncharacterized protein n=1 Tax=Senna tora TaxID=362788 RepID=A0A835CE64_9FABA|nr:uncharacterized protein G2W53_010526 [Senna tora]